jgi:hypothetical protein
MSALARTPAIETHREFLDRGCAWLVPGRPPQRGPENGVKPPQG